jgi:hypothetical protein
LALHGAIAWAAFRRDDDAVWLLHGILFASGKYLFLVQSLAGNELEARGRADSSLLESQAETTEGGRKRSVVNWLTSLVRLVGHADVRWHLWIVLALIGRLDGALAVYAVYFPFRALAGAVRKGVRYA